ncbi:MAG TPA: hypothetical protein IAC04_03465, partial [Candidatus Coprenecus stercoravium]|nr:hypothetical protein [Candidatus Coprenecus stercoravium]
MKSRLFLTIALMLVGLLSCNRKEETIAYSISLDIDNASFESDPFEMSVNIYSNGKWILTSEDDDSWCEASAYKGTGDAEITFKAEPNMDTTDRSIRYQIYVLQNEDEPAELLITQRAHIYSISVNHQTLSFNADGGRKDMVVSSSDEWTLEVEDDWCTPSVSSGNDGDTVTFSVNEYFETDEDRTTTAVFSCGNKKSQVKIKQASVTHAIAIIPEDLAFGADGGEKKVAVSSSGKWTLEVEDDWCTPSVSSGNDGDTVIFSVDEYIGGEKSRITYATFLCGKDKEAILTIIQAHGEHFVSITPDELTFDANGGGKDIVVSSSGKWTLEVEDSWCRPSVTSGDDGDTVTFSVNEYKKTDKNRSTIATFSCCGYTKKADITQAAKKICSISVEPEELIFYTNRTNIEVAVTSSDKWTLEVGDFSRFRPSIIRGQEGETTVLFSIHSFSSAQEESYAKFTCGDITKTITLIWFPYPEEKIVFDHSEIPVSYHEQDAVLSFTAYLDWSLSEFPEWCSADMTCGPAGKYEVTLHFDANYEQEERFAEIIASCGDKQTKIILRQSVSEDPFVDVGSSLLEKIVRYVDINGDGLISKSEAEAIEHMSFAISNSDQGDYSFDVFPNLRSLNITGNRAEFQAEYAATFDFSHHPNIQYVRISSTLGSYQSIKIPYIKLDHCDNLISVIIQDDSKEYFPEYYEYTKIGCIDVSGCRSLKSLIFSSGEEQSSQIKTIACDSIKANGCTSLQFISFKEPDYFDPLYPPDPPAADIAYVDVGGCASLTHLLLEGELENINAEGCTSLTHLLLNGELGNINVEGCTSLTNLRARVPVLDISTNRALKNLSCEDGLLAHLDISNNTKLEILECSGNSLSSLDISNNTALVTLR